MASEYNPITEEQPCEPQFPDFWRKNEMFYRATTKGFFGIQPCYAQEKKAESIMLSALLSGIVSYCVSLQSLFNTNTPKPAFCFVNITS